MKKLLATIVLAVCAAFTASAAVNLRNLTKSIVVKDGTLIKGTLTNANVRHRNTENRQGLRRPHLQGRRDDHPRGREQD